jgi:hypothetical protein
VFTAAYREIRTGQLGGQLLQGQLRMNGPDVSVVIQGEKPWPPCRIAPQGDSMFFVVCQTRRPGEPQPFQRAFVRS